MLKLDVGSGAKHDAGYITLDVSAYYGPDVRGDLLRLPFAANKFDEVRVHHVLEHIPREHLVAAMNEIWTVTREGGICDIEVPVFPFWRAIADPTHVSFFVPETFLYFIRCRERHEHGLTEDCMEDKRRLYGIRPWERVVQHRLAEGQILHIVLRKVLE